jgi:hypothetical protein
MKAERFEFNSSSERPLLFPREGGRGMSSKAVSYKNHVLTSWLDTYARTDGLQRSGAKLPQELFRPNVDQSFCQYGIHN